MKRRHSIEAEPAPAPAGDAEAALSAALAKLALLRQQVHADWSAGIAELVDFANADDAATDDAAWSLAAPASAADGLRGRFLDLDEPVAAPVPVPAPAPPLEVDSSWLALADEVAPPVAANHAPALELRGRLAPEDPEPLDELSVALAFTADVHMRAQAPAEPAVEETAAVFADEDEIILGVGAFVNFEMLAAPAPAPASPTLLPAADDEPASVTGYGAAAGILALAAPIVEAVSPAHVARAAVKFDDEPMALALGAAADLDALFALAAPAATPETAATPSVAAVALEEPLELAVGAFAIAFDIATPNTPAAPPAPTPEQDDEAPAFAVGAHAALAALLDAVPAPLQHAVEIRAFDPESLVDDALADAFEALLRAHDPLESAWAADAVTFDAETPAIHLAQCEAALWELPRHVPCIEAFLATPNHETAVKLTRALRLRAHALEARAFAEGVDFGFLQNDADAAAFWFMADALSDATGLATGDADVEASFPDWQVSDAGLIVVNAPGLAPQRPTAPLISEAELDALFAHVDEARAHVLDDLGEDAAWDEPYWSDVDAYLAAETTSWDPDDLEHLAAPYDPAHEILDIEVRDNTPEPPATHFWMPGDEPDLAIEGEGSDLFIVGGGDGDDAAVILLEDGATYAMRTGCAARMDEVIVSLSHDRWTHIDAMHWTRLAALSGVASVRVEQTAAASRRLVLAGAFLGTALEDGGARLVRSGDDGEEDHPVIRLGDATPFSFADLGGVAA